MKPIDRQTILITGATDGLGKQTALALVRLGAAVLLHGRSEERLERTRREIQDATGSARLETYVADLASLAKVRTLAREVGARHPALDMLINNAAVGPGGPGGARRELSEDGYELRFAVDYLAPFLLTHLLLPALRRTPPSRVINVGSVGQSPLDFDNLMLERDYEPLDAYRRSKLALAMFTFDLAQEVRTDRITVNCVHPATLMDTKMVREFFPSSRTTVDDGLESVMRLATDASLDGTTGRYFDRLSEARAHPQAYDPDARRTLAALSRELTGLR